ncbi:hypothetical protein E3N88_42218 [Mikania micrantha]|uniref:Uncharacterized protein n=1 Tax=Mikania micrantha TaxID=192012 RepID=A0A5N6LIG1_9ASTR|nr:hypothetical protein E3N88_42218 [Mikania micrantha]
MDPSRYATVPWLTASGCAKKTGSRDFRISPRYAKDILIGLRVLHHIPTKNHRNQAFKAARIIIGVILCIGEPFGVLGSLEKKLRNLERPPTARTSSSATIFTGFCILRYLRHALEDRMLG